MSWLFVPVVVVPAGQAVHTGAAIVVAGAVS